MHDIYPFISPLAALKDSAKGKSVLVTGGGKGIGRVGKIPSYSAFHLLISKSMSSSWGRRGQADHAITLGDNHAIRSLQVLA